MTDDRGTTMRQKMARAIHAAKERNMPSSIRVVWEKASPESHEYSMAYADAALDALLDPTEGMLDVEVQHIGHNSDAYALMIQAAKDGK